MIFTCLVVIYISFFVLKRSLSKMFVGDVVDFIIGLFYVIPSSFILLFSLIYLGVLNS